jgi:hypothetical protein
MLHAVPHALLCIEDVDSFRYRLTVSEFVCFLEHYSSCPLVGEAHSRQVTEFSLVGTSHQTVLEEHGTCVIWPTTLFKQLR